MSRVPALEVPVYYRVKVSLTLKISNRESVRSRGATFIQE